MASDASTSCGGGGCAVVDDDAEGETADDALFALPVPPAVGEGEVAVVVVVRPAWMEIGRRNGDWWDRGSKGPRRWEEEERWGGGCREEGAAVVVVVEEEVVVVCLFGCWW